MVHEPRTVFAQLISFLPDREFRRCVSRYDGDHRWRSFSGWDQFLSMAFAQLTYRESLRDIEACLRSLSAKLYHMGFRCPVARSTLADANESRDWRIYADFAQVLIRIARPLYARDPIGVDLDQTLYALDSTTIDLCLSLFPWAKFRRHKAAVKMQRCLHGNIPTFIRITDGKTTTRRDRPRARRMDRGRFRTPLRVHPLLVVLRRANQEEHHSNGATRIPSTGPRACARIRPSSWAPSNRPKRIWTRCGGSATSTPRRTSGCSS